MRFVPLLVLALSGCVWVVRPPCEKPAKAKRNAQLKGAVEDMKRYDSCYGMGAEECNRKLKDHLENREAADNYAF